MTNIDPSGLCGHVMPLMSFILANSKSAEFLNRSRILLKYSCFVLAII